MQKVCFIVEQNVWNHESVTKGDRLKDFSQFLLKKANGLKK